MVTTSWALGWTVFETALGACAIAWSEQGICGSQLPEADMTALAARMRARFPAARDDLPLPATVRRAIRGVQVLVAGDSLDLLLDVPLDETGLADFNRRVLALTRRIAVGQTRSYGELAAQLGQPGAARAVGMAQGQNPFAPIVPCHRVLGADGALTGFSAPGGLETKQRLLLIEARACGQLAGEQGALF
jgi:methylated-DNA-[protein]-cysteine S-methyltransferase